MSRLEIYAILLVMLGASIAGAYYKGKHDKGEEIQTAQLAADAVALGKMRDAMIQRALADDAARAKADEFVGAVDKGIANAKAKFGQLPQIVVDSRGCAAIGPNFGLRWNAAADSVPGAFGFGAAEPASAVRGESLPVAARPQ